MSKQSEDKRAYWRDVLERRSESGLSIRQFCREQQISEASFHSWKRKLAASERDARLPEDGAVFIPVHVKASSDSALELVHPRGHVLRVPAVFAEGSLRQILDILDGRGEK